MKLYGPLLSWIQTNITHIIQPQIRSTISEAVTTVSRLYSAILPTITVNRLIRPQFRFAQPISPSEVQTTKIRVASALFKGVGSEINRNEELSATTATGIAMFPYSHLHLTVTNHEEVERFSKGLIEQVEVPVSKTLMKDSEDAANYIYDHVLGYLQKESTRNINFIVDLPEEQSSTPAFLLEMVLSRTATRLNTYPNGKYFARTSILPNTRGIPVLVLSVAQSNN